MLLVACASTGGVPAAEQQVRERASERWQALIKGEFTRAYGYSTPGFKAVVTADGYRNRFGNGLTWTGAEVVRVSCQDVTNCVATLRIDYKLVLSRPTGATISTHVDETWLFEDGQWWYFQKI